MKNVTYRLGPCYYFSTQTVQAQESSHQMTSNQKEAPRKFAVESNLVTIDGRNWVHRLVGVSSNAASA